MINVVIFNGGRGASSLIKAFLKKDGFKVTSIVNAYDDGKSTGEIRAFFDMLGPSDIRKVQSLMLPKDNIDYESMLGIYELRLPLNQDDETLLGLILGESKSNSNTFFGFQFHNNKVLDHLRFYLSIFVENHALIKKSIIGKSITFRDCSIMNCLYAGAFIHHKRNIEHAAISFEKIFSLQGSVLPTSIENKKLVGLRSDGTILFSEAEIVELRSNVDIKRVFLLDEYPRPTDFQDCTFEEKMRYLINHHCYVSASDGTQRAIKEADIIIFSPGTQHSSLYPTYLSLGVSSNIFLNKRALKVFITNIGADYETPFFKAHDYINGALNYLNFAEDTNYKHSDLFSKILVNDNKFVTDPNRVSVDSESLKAIDSNISISNYEKDNSGKHDGELVCNEVIQLYFEQLSA